MNKSMLSGRLTRDPEVRYTQGPNPTAIARYTLAVDRRGSKEGEQSADFIPCVAFGRAAEFAERYLRKGTKMLITGQIRTGSYTNRDGQKVYTTEIYVEDQEFAESKSSQSGGGSSYQSNANSYQSSDNYPTPGEGFMDIPDDDGDIPFN